MNLGLENNKIRYKNNAFLNSKNTNFGSSVSFKGQVVNYAHFDKIIESVDDILGKDKYFQKLLSDSGYLAGSRINLPNNGVVNKLFEALKYPFTKMPSDIFDSTCVFLNKTPLKNKVKNILESEQYGQRLNVRNKEKSKRLARDILEEYFPPGADVESSLRRFKQDATTGITKVVKNYESRFERPLNRVGTATVSAIYSAFDFYNISMLQKDDKEEAKKAQKSRFKQEMTRMAMSATLTYLTMSALGKYTKKSVVADALVIALSALISEIGSRLLSKTPLHPLTPQEASKLAYKKKGSVLELYLKDNNPLGDIITKDTKSAKKEKEQKLYSQFTNNENNIQQQKNKDKNKKFIKKAALVFGATSLIALISKGLKGEFREKLAKRELFKINKEAILKYLNGTGELGENIVNEIEKINKKKSDTSAKFNIFDKLKEKLTTKEETLYPQNIQQKLKILKENPKASDISQILDDYINHADKLLSNGAGELAYRANLPLIPSVYEGITKLTKTLYRILSMPATAITSLVDSILFRDSEKAFREVAKKIEPNEKQLQKIYKEEIIALNKLFDKYKNSNNSDEKILEQIKKRTRAFELGSETGDLANLSRTMVTAISTYFFVNDYTNKVLIESGGKDVDKARIERNGRIAHKLSNFVINGTLMNLFNSIFKTPLNNSLVEATAVAVATEATNEFLVRKSICQPIGRMNSRDEILDYEEKQINRKGLLGAWSRFFMKITGKKTLTGKDGKELEQEKIDK